MFGVLLIDAYNVLHLPDAHVQGADLELEGLCALIGRSRYSGSRVVLVCDGAPPARMGVPTRHAGAARVRLGGVEVVFSGRSRSADDEIEDRLRAGRGAGVVLVSDDRRLRRAASRAGARPVSSSAFLAHLLVDREGRGGTPLPRFTKDIPLDAYSVEHWRREFGLAAMDPAAVARAGEGPDGRAGEARGPGKRAEPGGEGESEPPRARVSRDVARGSARAGGAGGAEPGSNDRRLEALRDDPLIREAIEAWRGRLRLEDLDMQRWLGEGPARGRESGR